MAKTAPWWAGDWLERRTSVPRWRRDDLFADPEAEAVTGVALGGEEGFEEALDDLGRDAGAGVGDGEDDASLAGAPAGGFAGADEEGAAGGTHRVLLCVIHGVERVGDEVGEDLADLAAEAAEGVLCAQACQDTGARVAQLSGVDVQDLGGQCGGVDLLRAGGLAVKAQGLGGDGGDAAQFDVRGVEVSADIVGRIAGAGEVEEVGDGLEGIVDLVGDGGGEAADGGEFFVLDEGLFGLFLMGDFERGGGDAEDGAVRTVYGIVADGPVAIVVGVGGECAFEGVVDDGFAAGNLVEELAEAGDGGHLGDGLADDLGGCEAEEGGLAFVEAEVVVVIEVEVGETDGCGVVDGLEFGVLARGFGGLLSELLAVGLEGAEDACALEGLPAA